MYVYKKKMRKERNINSAKMNLLARVMLAYDKWQSGDGKDDWNDYRLQVLLCNRENANLDYETEYKSYEY